MTTLPFGRHKGKPLSEVPDDYLDWLLTIDLKPWLEQAVKEERARRNGGQDNGGWRDWKTGNDGPKWKDTNGSAVAVPPRLKPVVKELIATGYRLLAIKVHPDKGGHHDDMVLLNEARAWMEKHMKI